MKRRQAIKTGALVTGYALIAGGSATTFTACNSDLTDDWIPSFLTQEEVKLVAEIAERIIPRTDIPGAKDALVDRYIDENIALNYTTEKQEKFRADLQLFDSIARGKFKKAFVKISDEQKDEILTQMYEEVKSLEKNEHHIFKEIRGMTRFGYCTSEIGAKEALIFDPIPQRYVGCIDYAEIGGVFSIDK